MQRCFLCSSPRFEHPVRTVYIRQRWHPTRKACSSSTAPCEALPLYSCPRCVCRNAAMTIEADHGGNKSNIDGISVWALCNDTKAITILLYSGYDALGCSAASSAAHPDSSTHSAWCTFDSGGILHGRLACRAQLLAKPCLYIPVLGASAAMRP